MIRRYYVDIIILILFIFSISSAYNVYSSSSEVKVSLTPDRYAVKPRDEFGVNVYVDPDGYGVSGGEVRLKYNPTVFKILRTIPGNLFGGNSIEGVCTVNESIGILRCSLARIGETSAPTSPGVFIRILFLVLGGSKEEAYHINLTFVGLADEKFNDIPRNQITIINTSIVVDNGPSISILNPMSNEYLSGNITVNLNVTGYGISRVEYYVDKQLANTVYTPPYSYIWNTKRYSDGLHMITVVAYDKYNISNQYSIEVYLDNTPPKIVNLTHYPTQPLENQGITIKLVASDLGSGMKNATLHYRIDEKEWIDVPMLFENGVWNADIPGERGGSIVEYYVTLYDVAGNGVDSPLHKFIVEISPSFEVTYFTITPGEIGIGKPVNITINVVNNGEVTGVYKIVVKVNGTIEAEKNIILSGGEEKTLVFKVAGDKPGVYQVEINGLTRIFKVKKPTETWIYIIAVIIAIAISSSAIILKRK